jgi:hypothetical protein
VNWSRLSRKITSVRASCSSVRTLGFVGLSAAVPCWLEHDFTRAVASLMVVDTICVLELTMLYVSEVLYQVTHSCCLPSAAWSKSKKEMITLPSVYGFDVALM